MKNTRGNPFLDSGLTGPTEASSNRGGWASKFLLGEAPRELNARLSKFEVPPLVREEQRGTRYLSIGYPLPLLRDALNDQLDADRQVQRVSWGLGLTLTTKDGGDFRLGEFAPKFGLYMGIRVQRTSPDGTVPVVLHDWVFNESIERLTRTKRYDWQRHSKYWSIWDSSVPVDADSMNEADLRDFVMDQYLVGLATLRGLWW